MTGFRPLLAPLLAPLLGLAASWPADAQITSAINAGQGSGNNASISSGTTIGVPNFSQPLLVSRSSRVTVGQDGNLSAPSSLLEQLEQALTASLNPALAPTAQSSPSQAAAPASRLSADFSLLAGADPLALQGSVAAPAVIRRADGVHVNVDGELVVLSTTPSTLSSLQAYAQKASQVGLAPSALQLGAEWVRLGTPIETTVQLVAAFQGIARQPDLNRLHDAITAYNAILKSSSPQLLTRLSADKSFVSTVNTLRRARDVFSDKP
jgi:hypothetical protein